MTESDLDVMTAGYLEAALFTADESIIPPRSGEFDASPYTKHIAKETQRKAADTCRDFLKANAADLAEYPARECGHDLWYTRNHHGCGFWEGDHCTDEQGERLTTAAHRLGDRSVIKVRGKFYIE